MRSPRSPGSGFVRPTVASTAATSYLRCPPIFTAPATIFIPRPATSRRRYCAAFTRPKWHALPKSSSGAAARLGASFSTSMTSPTPASIFCGTIPAESHINIGAGYDVTIAEFADHIKRCVGFKGRVVYDRSRPDGTPRKLLDSGRIQTLGWSATTTLEEGLKLYYDWF